MHDTYQKYFSFSGPGFQVLIFTTTNNDDNIIFTSPYIYIYVYLILITHILLQAHNIQAMFVWNVQFYRKRYAFTIDATIRLLRRDYMKLYLALEKQL